MHRETKNSPASLAYAKLRPLSPANSDACNSTKDLTVSTKCCDGAKILRRRFCSDKLLWLHQVDETSDGADADRDGAAEAAAHNLLVATMCCIMYSVF